MGLKIVDSKDKIGPGKPPKHSQFKPGQSGNPTGRPKGSKNLATLLGKELNKKITVTENGNQKKITFLEAVTRRLVTDSVKGNTRALELLLKTMNALGQKPDHNEQNSEHTISDPAALARIHKRLTWMMKLEEGNDNSQQ
jgi:hypothetical protein